MPRPLRIEYSGAWYHVMNPGINHMEIFSNDEHRNIFLNLLKEISQLFQVEIHSYCLMDNHYHLLLKTPHPNLGKAMRHLSGLYTLRYNRSLDRDGPLFRGRYKAILVEENHYLLKVSRYIHLNPVEAKIVEHPADYKWSSYNDFVNSKESNWVHTSLMDNFFESKNHYAEFIYEGVDSEIENFYNRTQLLSVMGTSKFIADRMSNLKDEYKFMTQPDVNRVKKLLQIENVEKYVTQYFGIPIAQLKTPHQKNNFPRLLAIYLARKLTQCSHQQISEYFTGIKCFSVTTRLTRCRELIENDSVVNMHYQNLMKIIDEEV